MMMKNLSVEITGQLIIVMLLDRLIYHEPAHKQSFSKAARSLTFFWFF